MLATILERDDYLGRVLTGLVETGKIIKGETIKGISSSGEIIEKFRATKILGFRGLKKQEVQEAVAGDIISLCGMQKTSVSDTICHNNVSSPLSSQPIDPPTISVTVGINDSPLAGKDGKFVQSRIIRERLFKESEGNIAIKVFADSSGENLEVFGRGELQIGILLENMRRDDLLLELAFPLSAFRRREWSFTPQQRALSQADVVLSRADERTTAQAREIALTHAAAVIEKRIAAADGVEDAEGAGAATRSKSAGGVGDLLLDAAGMGVKTAQGVFNMTLSTTKMVTDTALNPAYITYLLSAQLQPLQGRLSRYNKQFRALRRLLLFEDVSFSTIGRLFLTGVAIVLPYLPWTYLMRGAGLALLGPHMYLYGSRVYEQEAAAEAAASALLPKAIAKRYLEADESERAQIVEEERTRRRTLAEQERAAAEAIASQLLGKHALKRRQHYRKVAAHSERDAVELEQVIGSRTPIQKIEQFPDAQRSTAKPLDISEMRREHERRDGYRALPAPKRVAR